MDPSTQLIIDALRDLQQSLIQRFDRAEKTLSSRFGALEAACQVFEDGTPHVDAVVRFADSSASLLTDMPVHLSASDDIEHTVSVSYVLDAPLDAGRKFVIPLSRGSESSILGSMLESNLAHPEQLAIDAAATDYSSACDELTPSEPDEEEFATCITPAPAVSKFQRPQDALESLISAPSDNEDDYCGSLPTRAPPPTLQVLELLGINESQNHSAGNELLVGDPLLLTPSYILVADRLGRLLFRVTNSDSNDPAEDDDMYLCDAHARSRSVGLILDPDPRRHGRYLVAQLYPRDSVLHGDRLPCYTTAHLRLVPLPCVTTAPTPSSAAAPKASRFSLDTDAPKPQQHADIAALEEALSKREAGKRALQGQTPRNPCGAPSGTSTTHRLSCPVQMLNHLHRANRIDFPGHADLCSAVSAATRLLDSALIIVDVAKGVRIQTHATFVERLRPYLILNKLDRLLTIPARWYLPASSDASAVFTCTAPVLSSASAMAIQLARVTTTQIPVGAEGLGDLKALVLAGDVFVTGGESSFHLFRNVVLNAIPRNALARLVCLHGASSTAYYVANPTTFACDYRAHDDPAVIIAFDLDQRDADHQRAYTVYAFESFYIGPVECALRAVPLGGYDGSLDEVALAEAAALRANAVGAAGGGPLAWVVVAGSARATCSTVCQAGDRCFTDVPVGALWEGKMFRWDDNNHGLAPVAYVADLEFCNLSAHAELLGAAGYWNHCQVVIDAVLRVLSVFLYEDLCTEPRPPVAFDTTGCYVRAAVPVAASGGLVLYHATDTGTLSVTFLLTGASRSPQPQGVQPLPAIAMSNAPYCVALLLFVYIDTVASTAVASARAKDTEAVIRPLHMLLAADANSSTNNDAA